ncbi:hypothetical protein FEI15_00790 [Lacticaseibacillus zeae]|uniref:Uncharacterized protein n=1 Tax=Lacticaseibacillus zeae TaxID=57037 RepID=A0A5R8LWT2_LACZE|nr:hypothetical protein [Lacticaseibacillus zeae]TLF41777.1 hypothetical protein FEI15_00790 [Lacticaseibacillus zeae]
MQANKSKNLSDLELTKIVGGDSSMPGRQGWLNGIGEPDKGKNRGSADSGWGDALGKKIAECIAYGLAGRRGPFGCNS